MAAYNFARRLETLSGLTPYEYIAKIWTSEPDRFIVIPIHQMPGLSTYAPPAISPKQPLEVLALPRGRHAHRHLLPGGINAALE